MKTKGEEIREEFVHELSQKLGGPTIPLDCMCGSGEPRGEHCTCPWDMPNQPRHAKPILEKHLNTLIDSLIEGMKGEKLRGKTGEPEDIAYDQAIEDCLAIIKEVKGKGV